MRNITTEELKALQEKNAGLTLVNTLKRDEFAKTKIPNSVNIPLESEDFVACVEKAAGCKTSQVVVYCANSTCDASEVAAKKLEEAGFTDVARYTGGAEAWQGEVCATSTSQSC
ncbi:MAG: rhodanese-like domain-containing protein [Planctomycetales bacterium]|nr:rhodanese-like domain-containing protein [Planctomycetales bacterium]